MVVDLDGNGVDIVLRTQSTVRFDIDHDGFLERTAWAGAHDGMLVIDLGGDGRPGGDCRIDQTRELVFTQWDPAAQSDMEALRTVFDKAH